MAAIQATFNSPNNPYRELVAYLEPHCRQPQLSYCLVVEGTISNPIVMLKYPGNRVKKFSWKRPRADSPTWPNLFDFYVEPYIDGVPSGNLFSYPNLLDDFVKHKIENQQFWEAIVTLYKTNRLTPAPNLGGIDSNIYLSALKWIWIQEELNYVLLPKDVGASETYRTEKRGVGKTKYYAGLLLAHSHDFTVDQILKIIY